MAKLFSNEKNIRLAKEAAGQQQAGAIYGMEAASAQSARQIAGEEAKANIFSALGQDPDFRYGDGSNTSMWDKDAEWDPNLAQFATYGGKKPFGKGKGSKKKGGSQSEAWNRKGIIDPEGYANKVLGSVPFQIRSKQTAEALQLLNKEGPAWDELENATIGTIHEGAALQLRDTLRQLRNNYAKGGTARRTAVNEYSTIMAQERAMRSRVQETWQANLRLHSYIRQNADRVEAGNRSFVENINGLSAAHMAAMQATAALQVEAGKTAGLLAGQAYEIRASQVAVNFGTSLAEAVIVAAISAVVGSVGGPIAQLGVQQALSDDGSRGLVDVGTGDSNQLTGGGDSGLFGKFLGSIVGGAGKYSSAQQDALDRANQIDPNAAAAAHLGPKNTAGGVAGAFTKKNAWMQTTGSGTDVMRPV